MEKIVLPMRKILDVFDAVSAVDDNDLLPTKTSYWLGRLKDKCKSLSRPAVRDREKLTRKFQALMEGKKANEVEELSSDFLDKLDAILDVESEEFQMPDFKMSDFEAKEDVVKEVKNADGTTSKVTIKKGQSLVSVKFYSLMGELVKAE